MTQDAEAKRTSLGKKKPGASPGTGLGIAIAVISGILCWFWLGSGRPNSRAPNVSDLTEVDERDVTGALTTMNLPNSALTRFKESSEGECRRPLAWVSLVSAQGEPPSHIRLISGTYYSPAFEVSATPVRVAIPFPAPYETGQGMLTAIDVGGSATVSLLPSWHISAQDGKATRAVSWQPRNRCSPRK
jgi:hypothetical protein